jgi:hypothetical protein
MSACGALVPGDKWRSIKPGVVDRGRAGRQQRARHMECGNRETRERESDAVEYSYFNSMTMQRQQGSEF